MHLWNVYELLWNTCVTPLTQLWTCYDYFYETHMRLLWNIYGAVLIPIRYCYRNTLDTIAIPPMSTPLLPLWDDYITTVQPLWNCIDTVMRYLWYILWCCFITSVPLLYDTLGAAMIPLNYIYTISMYIHQWMNIKELLSMHVCRWMNVMYGHKARGCTFVVSLRWYYSLFFFVISIRWF